MANVIKLSAEQVVEISVIDHKNPYKNGQRAKDGKTFSRFRYEGVVFTVDSDNPFIQAFESGNVKHVKLMEGERDTIVIDAEGNETTQTVRTLTFDSMVTRAQWRALQNDKVEDAEVDYKIKRFEHLASAPVTTDLLNELQNA